MSNFWTNHPYGFNAPKGGNAVLTQEIEVWTFSDKYYSFNAPKGGNAVLTVSGKKGWFSSFRFNAPKGGNAVLTEYGSGNIELRYMVSMPRRAVMLF